MVADARGKAFSTLRRRLPAAVLLWKIENSAGPGLPDCYGVGHGVSFWVEFKVGTLRPTVKVPKYKLRSSQYATLIRLHRAGVPCYLGVYCRGELWVARFSPELWRALGESEGAVGFEAKLPGEAP